ncbi:Pol [Symbiodinium sp. CCMP2592]|nr:Pol [Symbiodinium sp. CCMP2592]
MIWDVFDVQELAFEMFKVISMIVLRYLEEICMCWAPTMFFTVLTAQILLLLWYMRWYCPMRISKSGQVRTPTWARMLLGFAVIGKVAAGPPSRWQKPSDLDWWRDGLQTPAEHARAVEAVMQLNSPLHSQGLLPPNVYEAGPPRVPPEPPDPLDDDPGGDDLAEHQLTDDEAPRAVHVSVWIATPHSEPESVDVGLAFPLTLNGLFDVARESVNAMSERWLSSVVATRPQLSEDYASLLLLPEWVHDSDKTAIVLDARPAGRGVHAYYVQGAITRYAALQKIDIGPEEPYEVFIGGDLAPLGHQSTRNATQGLVLQVLPRGQVVEWAGHLEDRLDDPARWNPESEHPALREGRLISFQSATDQFMYKANRRDNMQPMQVATWAFNVQESQIWLRAPTERPHRLCWAGHRVHSVIAVVDRALFQPADTQIVFLDLRGIGHWPQWVAVQDHLFHAGLYVESLQIEVIPEYTIVVRGGTPHGNEGHVWVADGDTLDIHFQRVADLTPSPTSHGSEGSEESSSTRDALPDSSDLSGSPPRGPGPWGPPPPRPVNQPRSASRSPRRHALAGEEPPVPVTICLANQIPVPVYDLTMETLELPDVPASWKDCPTPWPLTWLIGDISQLPLKDVTKAAIDTTVDWRALLSKPRGAEELHVLLYTDGSANQQNGTSGYAVTILLRIGTCLALFGLLSEQLCGDSTTAWPIAAPAALRAEQIAVTAALLWVLQFRSMLGQFHCEIHFDCLTAGYAATGQWKAPDEFGQKAHHLEMYLRAQPGIELSMGHVKAHEMQTLDLAWLVSEVRAQQCAALPIKQGRLTWKTFRDDGFRLNPSQLVPTVSRDSCSAAQIPRNFDMQVAVLNVQGFGRNYAYLEAQLDELDSQVVMFQETKAPGGVIRTRKYIRLATESLSKWGVAVWIHRVKGIMYLNEKATLVDENDVLVVDESPRLLVLRVTCAGVRLGIIAAHCPHEAKGTECWDFLDRLERGVNQVKKDDIVVLGIDLNGRVPCGVEGTTGPVECGTPDAIGRKFVKLMASTRMWLPSTYRHLHEGIDTTFVHPSGSEHRIDFIAVGGRAVSTAAKSSVHLDFDTGSPREDHRLVVLHMKGMIAGGLSRAALWRPVYDRDKLMSPAGQEILAEACQAFEQPAWNVSPDEHCNLIQEMLHATLQTHFLAEKHAANSSYIPQEVWELRRAKTSLKKATRGRIRLWKDLVDWAWQKWRTGAETGLLNLISKQGLLYQIAAAAIRYATARISADVAKARQTFLSGILHEGHQGAGQVLRRVCAAGVGGAKARQKKRPLPALLHPKSGQTVGHREGYDQVWLEHFGGQEQGEILPTDLLIEQAAQPMPTEDVTWHSDFLPTQADVQQVLRAVPRRKAAGLDNLPGEVLTSGHAALAAVLHPLYVKAMLLARQPLQWRGGILYECYKQSGSCQDVANFRSLFVSSMVGKCYHKLVKSKIQAQTQTALHPLHCGPRQKAPVLFPELYILTHVRRCHQKKLNYAILFLDTKSAYYSIARELVVGDICLDQTVIKVLQRFNLGPEDLRELMEVISGGGVMQQAGVEPALRQVIRDLHYQTWFTPRFADGSRACRTYAGSRPGESFADTVFAWIYSKILCSIYEAAAAEDLAFALPYDAATGAFGNGREGVEEQSWDATWADDSAFPTAATTCEEVIRKATRLSDVVIGTCLAHGLVPNMKVGKTSMILYMRGKDTVKVKQRLFADGKPVLKLPETGQTVPLVPQYRHLGGFVDINNTMMVEARHRVAMAAQAYDKSAKLLLNRRDLSVEVRAGLFHINVTASFFNVALWVPKGRAWSLMNNAYSRLVRRLLTPLVKGDRIFHVPLIAAHLATGCWCLDLVARRARLGLLTSLVAHGPDLLWAALQEEQSWLLTVQDDLRWFVRDNPDAWPQANAADWPNWWTRLKEAPATFKKQVTRKLKADHAKTCEQAMVDLCHWSLYNMLPLQRAPAQEDKVWKCWICDVKFSTKAKLSVHFFKRHQRVAEYRKYVHGTFCAGCGTEFWTGRRLMAHLRSSTRCVSALKSCGGPVSKIHAGFGSRQQRKEDVEQYTPAVPVQTGTPQPAGSAGQWSCQQSQLYEVLCTIAFEYSDPDSFHDRVCRALRTLPLYPDEIGAVFEFLEAEMKFLVEQDTDPIWSKETLDHIHVICGRICDCGAQTSPTTTHLPPRQETFEEFQRLLQELDWNQLLASIQAEHGTPPEVLCLPANWEAEWKAGRETQGNSAVLDKPATALPQVLQQAWTRVAAGMAVQLQAPKAFWSHSVARPFVPLRNDHAIN